MKPHRLRALLGRSLPLMLLLLAALLRFYRLDAQSFWNDEGNSARIAERPLGLILEAAAGDIHPPGYYILLHGWRALAGHSEFALRFPSALAGVALVALTLRLGRRSFGRDVGLAAGWLAALSPFAIYYSQEARMYALLGALGAASTLVLGLLLRVGGESLAAGRGSLPAPRAGWLVAYVLLGTAGLYTQYIFPFILAVHNVVFGVAWWMLLRRTPVRWRWLLAWGGAQAAMAVLYLPWLPIALGGVTGWSAAGRSYPLAAALLDVLRVLSLGLTWPLERAAVGMVCFGMLFVLGLLPAREGWGERLGVLTFALYALGPIGLVVAFDLYKPAWLKFLLIVLPAWHVLVARGIVRLAGWARHRARSLSRVVTIATCLALAGLSAPSLANLYFNPVYARDDYRGIAAHIAASAAPDACVVLDAPNQWEVFTYYYPDRDVYPAPYRPSPAEARQFVERVLERCERLYVLYWGQAESDPQALIETALAECTYTADARWYGNVRLVLYGVGATPAAPRRPSGAAFGASIRLQGVAVEEMVARGGILPVTLFWQALAPIGERYKVTVQLLDAQGQLVAQHDGEPGAGLAPTTAWAVGEQVVDRHGIPLPGELGAGEYTLLVGLYHALSGERLPVSVEGQAVGDHLRIGTISCCR